MLSLWLLLLLLLVSPSKAECPTGVTGLCEPGVTEVIEETVTEDATLPPSDSEGEDAPKELPQEVPTPQVKADTDTDANPNLGSNDLPKP